MVDFNPFSGSFEGVEVRHLFDSRATKADYRSTQGGGEHDQLPEQLHQSRNRDGSVEPQRSAQTMTR